MACTPRCRGGRICPPVQELPSLYKQGIDCTRKGYAASVTLLRRERPRYHVAALLAMTKTLPYLSLRAEERGVAISCRSYRVRASLFARTVCRFADGTPGSSCPTTVDRSLRVQKSRGALRNFFIVHFPVFNASGRAAFGVTMTVR